MQKEKLSALMDGETLDQAFIGELSRDQSLQQTWESYHLIRDTLRGDTRDTLHFDISAKVMAAIASDSRVVPAASPLIPEAQPIPRQWQSMGFWHKLRPWAAQITQVGVAACVSLVAILGVQHYNSAADISVQPEGPVFNTLPMMGKASPVSLGVPDEATISNSTGQQQYQEQRRRINAMLQDYELQRRLHSEQLQFEQAQTQQAALQVPGNQTLGTQSQ